MVNVKLTGKNPVFWTPVVPISSLLGLCTHMNILCFVLDQIFIHISWIEQAALFTLLSTILPKENVPPPSVPPPVAPDTFSQAEK